MRKSENNRFGNSENPQVTVWQLIIMVIVIIMAVLILAGKALGLM